MIAITVLTLTLSGAMGLSASLVKQERKAIAVQNMMDNSSYFLEYGGRFVRMAQKDDGDCITSGQNYENIGGDLSTVAFLDYEDHCHEFLLEDGQIKERVSSTDKVGDLGSATPITSSKITISSLSFVITGDSANHQPRITIRFSAEDQNFPESSMDVETTISQRNLNS